MSSSAISRSQSSSGNSVDRRDVLHAGVGHDDVEAAEALDRRGHGGAVAGAGGQVGLERLAGRRRGRARGPRRAPRAVGLEACGDGAADAARRSGHEVVDARTYPETYNPADGARGKGALGAAARSC